MSGGPRREISGVKAGVTTSAHSLTPIEAHQALFYRGSDESLAGISGFIGPALERDEPFDGEVVDVGGVGDQPGLDELRDPLLAEALDVHG